MIRRTAAAVNTQQNSCTARRCRIRTLHLTYRATRLTRGCTIPYEATALIRVAAWVPPRPRGGERVEYQRVRLHIDGTVQGVGFRPYVYRLASTLGLGGFVCNDARGVVVEVEGPPLLVRHFIERLPVDAPPLAVCGRVQREELPLRAGRARPRPFAIVDSAIVDSQLPTQPAALVSPDAATCADCLAELRDAADRRYRYPFINCTNCGPRFTIVRGVPYDRPRTTMAAFQMCARCQAEYDDPGSRRFHAQPNACPVCGPAARLTDGAGRAVAPEPARDAVAAAAAALVAGAIVAVKGIGGYHLACRTDDGDVVARLRQRKHREEKPFALMVPDLAAARRLVVLDAVEEELLTARARPIVLARRRPDAAVAPGVAPGQRDLGVMLPYAPLHDLLLGDAGVPLVLTSGNQSDEPIAYRDDDARARLGAIADLFLVHDRPIETRTDDSVVRAVSVGGARRPLMLRRSRGYVPAPVDLPVAATHPVLACGGQQKNTYCLARGRRAWVGPHVGDLENYETLRSFTDGVAHLEQLCALAPAEVAHDLHPEYLSTKYALDRVAAVPALHAEGVQHHHAHLAACLAEHGERGPALGVIFDGTGYGTDGDVWGGEFLVGDLTQCERVGYLWPVRMPGGAAAVREPWRMACAWLAECAPGVPALPDALADRVDPARWQAIAQLARSGVASPRTTSIGRLLDAVAALCGVRDRVSYEGQAAIELEALADPDERGRYALPRRRVADALVLDGRALVREVMRDLIIGVAPNVVSARVHNGVGYAAVRSCLILAGRHGLRTVVLSGGVFQNVLLLECIAAGLTQAGLRVLVPQQLPPNDGGLAYGQAAVAAARQHQAVPADGFRSAH